MRTSINKSLKLFLHRCDSQPLVGGIPVPVVKTAWMSQIPGHSTYGHDVKDWNIHQNSMMDLCHQKYHQRGVISESMPKVAIL